MKKQIRCAIYTRKSSEEGLEQDFNSLDAQREACEAYIKSQMHEGWVLIEKQYNDGGFSGGNMERPAFQELLSDIESDEIDIVVVYKVDRLTRSLMDFAKIIDIFDKHETSFVSITQQFNTTTSMGRLTLNILLSFAQFEREVTGERIRDKFAASRKKGMFMHGIAPIGYIKKDGILYEDKEHSHKIKTIFEKYIEFKSVAKLHNYLNANQIYTRTGKSFRKGNLHRILRNKVYIGKIEHKNEVYEGLHDGIIDEKTFNKVQKIMDENSVNAKNSTGSKHISLLAGKIFDDKGNIMSPSHSRNRHGACYRYYISQAIIQNRAHEAGTISKIPSDEIEQFISEKIKEIISDKEQIQNYIKDKPIKKQSKILEFLESYNPDIVFIRLVLSKITIYQDKIRVLLDKDLLVQSIEAVTYGQLLNFKSSGDYFLDFSYAVKISPAHQKGTKIVIDHNKIEYNLTLIQAITKGFYYFKLLQEGKMTKEQKSSSHIRRLMKLRLLSPEIIESVLCGTQDRSLTIKELYTMAVV